MSTGIWKTVMGQNAATLKRCRGRPQIRPDEETLRLVVEAAGAEFQANGYAAATMGNVAQRAGISTKTMYRLIPCKADLFKKVISERIGRFMLEVDPSALDAYELTDAVEHILIAFGELTLDEETIALVRLVIGECDRFPELAATFHEVAVVQTSLALSRWLESQRLRGVIDFDDSAAAVSALRGMMTMDLQRTAMLGLSEAPTREEIKARARFCAKLFIDGCRAGKRDSI
jgi:AcrR family transcriptional regulator